MQGFTTDAYSQERSRAEAKRMNLLVQDSIKQDTIATALSTQHFYNSKEKGYILYKQGDKNET